MAFNRGYQPNPWVSGAPPNQQSVMSGLMAAGYGQQPTGHPQNHFAPQSNYNNLASANGINWNQPGLIPNGQLRMGQQTGWNQNLIAGNQRGNQRVSFDET